MRFSRCLLSGILIIISFGFSFGQSEQSLRDSIAKNSPFDHSFIKFSPMAMVEIEPSLMIGYEYKLNSKIRLQHEVGYVALFNPAYYVMIGEFPDGRNSNGFKLRSTIKFSLTIDNLKARNQYRYLGIDVMYKYLQTTEYDVSVSQLGGAYFQYMDITTSKNVGAIHFLYGNNRYLSQSNSIITDWYVGVGLRFKSVKDDSPPYSDYWGNGPWYDDIDGIMISIMAGMKLGFGLD